MPCFLSALRSQTAPTHLDDLFPFSLFRFNFVHLGLDPGLESRQEAAAEPVAYIVGIFAQETWSFSKFTMSVLDFNISYGRLWRGNIPRVELLLLPSLRCPP